MPYRRLPDPGNRRCRHHTEAKYDRAAKAKYAPGEKTAKCFQGVRSVSRSRRWVARDALNADRMVNILNPPIPYILEEKSGAP
jgi:hypothetical protein